MNSLQSSHGSNVKESELTGSNENDRLAFRMNSFEVQIFNAILNPEIGFQKSTTGDISVFTISLSIWYYSVEMLC